MKMLKKEYGICNKPSLNSARKRILNNSKIIKFDFPEKLIGIGNGKNYILFIDSEKLADFFFSKALRKQN